MAQIEMNHPKIVQYAQRGFLHYLAAGDEHDAALHKATEAALAKLWRRRPLDMSKARNAARYGEQFSALLQAVAKVQK